MGGHSVKGSRFRYNKVDKSSLIRKAALMYSSSPARESIAVANEESLAQAIEEALDVLRRFPRTPDVIINSRVEVARLLLERQQLAPNRLARLAFDVLGDLPKMHSEIDDQVWAVYCALDDELKKPKRRRAL
jgi:hypothetical protein